MTHLPPEWAPQERLWIGFPGDPAEWPVDRPAAQAQAAAFANAVAANGTAVTLFARTAEDFAAASMLAEPEVDVAREPFGDIWLRDTGPLGIVDAAGKRAFIDFGFNGWGGKFHMPGDETIGARLAASARLPCTTYPIILEGGAIDVDGAGLAVTTEQCLLNPNRNPYLTRAEIEQRLGAALGITRVLWLGDGLANDHTDGHVDNLARFVAPGRVALPEPASEDDPNAAVYRDAAARARDFGLEVVLLPSPGLVEVEGEAIPASYMNFYIGNAAVIVPVYGAPNDAQAVAAIQALFPDRVAIGLRADHILTGGGSFHCISQQIPAHQA